MKRKTKPKRGKINKSRNFHLELYTKGFVTKKVKGRKTKRLDFKKIDESKFIPGRYYRVYLVNNKTKERRLYGFGHMKYLPGTMRRNPNTQELEPTKKGHAYRAFFRSAKGKKTPKGWINTNRMYESFEKEAKQGKKDLLADTIGMSTVPMRKFYHPRYSIFSDKKENLNEYQKVVGVYALVDFAYARNSFVAKQLMFIDLRDQNRGKGLRLKDLQDHQDYFFDKLQDYYNQHYGMPAINGLIETSVINGFLPASYVPREKQRRRKNGRNTKTVKGKRRNKNKR